MIRQPAAIFSVRYLTLPYLSKRFSNREGGLDGREYESYGFIALFSFSSALFLGSRKSNLYDRWVEGELRSVYDGGRSVMAVCVWVLGDWVVDGPVRGRRRFADPDA